MSALAHMVESRGIATVVIGLVRGHLEKAKPPRSVWVPFPLGRPLGEAENPAFQRLVLMQALRLLERKHGPVILEDFPEDAPSMTDAPGWAAQIVLTELSTPADGDVDGWVAAMAAELAKVLPHWEAAQYRFGRTTVGISGLSPEAWIPFAARFLANEIPPSPVAGLSSALVLRTIGDDLKALYSEAVQAIGPQPSPAQINGWFWGETLAASFLRALRTVSQASEQTGFKTVGGRFLVPAPFVAKV